MSSIPLAYGLRVSILAHLAKWALHRCTSSLIAPFKFQSSPTSQSGRYGEQLTELAEMFGFNPRPPRKVGATCSLGPYPLTPNVSILAHLAKWALRVHCRRKTRLCLCFNPRPPRKVGATRKSPSKPSNTIVSILAHLAKWALLPTGIKFGSIVIVFQSSPTSQSGRYFIINYELLIYYHVSILAHLAKWALRSYSCC